MIILISFPVKLVSIEQTNVNKLLENDVEIMFY